MTSRWIGVAATALLVTGPAWAASGQSAEPAARRLGALTASAWAALGKGDAVKAVQDAEAATLLSPRDAKTRLLLGRAYLAAGRFASADTAFRDTLTLDPMLTRASISRALAQIAMGKEAAARASLMAAEGHAADADIGLALVLLGDGEDALARLNAAARTQGADARTRQNLGLAYALQGRWSEAVAIAEQDVPADMMAQRLRRWATIAQLGTDRAMQVGAILGVAPAADQGQPAALALAAPAAAPGAPTALAIASPPPAPVAPVVHNERGSVVTTTSFTPPPLETRAATPVMTAVSAESVQAAAVVAPVAAWAGPPRMRKSRILDASSPRAPKTVGIKPEAPTKRLILASHLAVKPASGRGSGAWAVQLGAFSSERRTEIAWGRLSNKARFLNAYTPTGSGLRWGKATLYRLSVSGLPTRAEATSLCVRIKASGGKCFVRNMSGDRPVTWALRSRTEQPV